jgi:hypothetical protein
VILITVTSLDGQDLHKIEENHKVPKQKTAMGFGEIIYSKTNSAGYSRRKT